MIGMPDIGLITSDELVAATERISNTTNLPIIVDADEGYGDSPLMVYRTCQRLAKAGAMAISIDDTTAIRGFERSFMNYDNGFHSGLCSMEEFLAKINAAVAGVEGTDCMIIARTAAKRRNGMEDAIERMVRSDKLGAHMTMVLNISSLDECRQINEALPGWKMFPDVYSVDGQPVVKLADIYELGFNLVTCHYLEKGAMWGMLDYGQHVFADKNTAYSDDHDMGGVMENGWMSVYEELSMYKKWLALEAKFRDEI
jgi:2-methylisocitrate lyase-like PEP mutase family enzyme